MDHLTLVLTTPSKPYSFDRAIALGAIEWHAKCRKTPAYVALRKGWQDPVTILKFSWLLREVPSSYNLQQTIDFIRSLIKGWRENQLKFGESPWGGNLSLARESGYKADRAFDLVLALRWVRRFKPAYFAVINANGRLTRRELPSNLSSVTLAQDGSGAVIERRAPAPVTLAAE